MRNSKGGFFCPHPPVITSIVKVINKPNSNDLDYVVNYAGITFSGEFWPKSAGEPTVGQLVKLDGIKRFRFGKRAFSVAPA